MNLDLASMTVAQLKARAKELGVDDDERVTRSNGHRPVKDDWLAVVIEALEENQPSQADIIRQGLVDGLDNDEIQEAVLEVYPDGSPFGSSSMCASRAFWVANGGTQPTGGSRTGMRCVSTGLA